MANWKRTNDEKKKRELLTKYINSDDDDERERLRGQMKEKQKVRECFKFKGTTHLELFRKTAGVTNDMVEGKDFEYIEAEDATYLYF